MAISFSIPKSPTKSIFQMDYFQGCDFTNSPANVDDFKSPNCVNMIRDVPGKIRKSMGYHTIRRYPGAVNGAFYLRSSDEQLIHAGEEVYFNDVRLYKGINNHRSKSWQFDKKLYIQDGKELLVHECKDADIKEGYTYGHHEQDVEGLTYEIDMTISSGDKVYFKFPYKLTSISVSGVASKTISFESPVMEYVFTADVDGAHKFTCNAFFEQKSISTNNAVFTVPKIGKGTELTFTSTDPYYITHITQKYVDSDLVARTIEYNIDNRPEWVWENTLGDYEYTFEVTYEVITTGEGTCTGLSDVEPETPVVGASYDLICNITGLEIDSVITFDFVTPPATSDIPQTMKWECGEYSGVETIYEYGQNVENFTFVCPHTGDYTFTFTYPDEIYDHYYTLTYSWIREIFDTHGEISYINTLGMRGTESFTINRDYGEDGFIDNTDGKYIDEYHLVRTVKKVAAEAYIPTVTIAKEPQGGGTSYESLNLIQPGFIELFSGKANVTAYQLSFKGLDATEVIVKLLDGNGNWVTKKEGTHFSVDRKNGIINFTSAPGPSPLTGEDNVSIQAYRTVKGYADRINKCTISILFGVHGNADRLFVSGNPEYINYDWYSQQYDPTYFPDTGYSVLGSSSSAIVGYTIISNYLAAHKDDKERDSNIILREGDLVDNEPSFPIVATLQGAGAVAPWSFDYLETEPIFLTKSGIYAVTAQDITGEKYSQNRSYYIDGKLLKEENLKDAYSCVYNDFYFLAINGKLYILDGLQPIQTDKSMPYATRQYACFYRENVPANCIWTFEEKLYFGTADGRVCEFYTDKNDLYSYNDDGKAIECVWETPDLDGRYFFKNKTFRYLAVRLDSAIATSINIYTMKRGIWSLAKHDSSKGMYFTFPYLNFDKFSFATDTTQKIVHSKLRVKKVDKARFRFTNTELNEPFGIFDVALEYVENGNYKG